jgi:hypothetical protein
MHMTEALVKSLARAVHLRNSIVTRRDEHKKRVQELTQKRSALYIKATDYLEDSPAMSEFHRQLDLLDKQEFELHDEFKKFLRKTDDDLTIAIGEIVREKFGPDWDFNSAI